MKYCMYWRANILVSLADAVVRRCIHRPSLHEIWQMMTAGATDTQTSGKYFGLPRVHLLGSTLPDCLLVLSLMDLSSGTCTLQLSKPGALMIVEPDLEQPVSTPEHPTYQNLQQPCPSTETCWSSLVWKPCSVAPAPELYLGQLQGGWGAGST